MCECVIMRRICVYVYLCIMCSFCDVKLQMWGVSGAGWIFSWWKRFGSNHIVEQGDETFTQYAARSIYEKRTMGIGIIYARMNIREYIIIMLYLEVTVCILTQDSRSYSHFVFHEIFCFTRGRYSQTSIFYH